MRNRKQKLISLVLAMLMCLSLFPVSAFAEEADLVETVPEEIVTEEEVQDGLPVEEVFTEESVNDVVEEASDADSMAALEGRPEADSIELIQPTDEQIGNTWITVDLCLSITPETAEAHYNYGLQVALSSEFEEVVMQTSIGSDEPYDQEMVSWLMQNLVPGAAYYLRAMVWDESWVEICWSDPVRVTTADSMEGIKSLVLNTDHPLTSGEMYVFTAETDGWYEFSLNGNDANVSVYLSDGSNFDSIYPDRAKTSLALSEGEYVFVLGWVYDDDPAYITVRPAAIASENRIELIQPTGEQIGNSWISVDFLLSITPETATGGYYCRLELSQTEDFSSIMSIPTEFFSNTMYNGDTLTAQAVDLLPGMKYYIRGVLLNADWTPICSGQPITVTTADSLEGFTRISPDTPCMMPANEHFQGYFAAENDGWYQVTAGDVYGHLTREDGQEIRFNWLDESYIATVSLSAGEVVYYTAYLGSEDRPVTVTSAAVATENSIEVIPPTDDQIGNTSVNLNLRFSVTPDFASQRYYTLFEICSDPSFTWGSGVYMNSMQNYHDAGFLAYEMTETNTFSGLLPDTAYYVRASLTHDLSGSAEYTSDIIRFQTNDSQEGFIPLTLGETVNLDDLLPWENVLFALKVSETGIYGISSSGLGNMEIRYQDGMVDQLYPVAGNEICDIVSLKAGETAYLYTQTAPQGGTVTICAKRAVDMFPGISLGESLRVADDAIICFTAPSDGNYELSADSESSGYYNESRKTWFYSRDGLLRRPMKAGETVYYRARSYTGEGKTHTVTAGTYTPATENSVRLTVPSGDRLGNTWASFDLEVSTTSEFAENGYNILVLRNTDDDFSAFPDQYRGQYYQSFYRSTYAPYDHELIEVEDTEMLPGSTYYMKAFLLPYNRESAELIESETISFTTAESLDGFVEAKLGSPIPVEQDDGIWLWFTAESEGDFLLNTSGYGPGGRARLLYPDNRMVNSYSLNQGVFFHLGQGKTVYIHAYCDKGSMISVSKASDALPALPVGTSDVALYGGYHFTAPEDAAYVFELLSSEQQAFSRLTVYDPARDMWQEYENVQVRQTLKKGETVYMETYPPYPYKIRIEPDYSTYARVTRNLLLGENIFLNVNIRIKAGTSAEDYTLNAVYVNGEGKETAYIGKLSEVARPLSSEQYRVVFDVAAKEMNNIVNVTVQYKGKAACEPKELSVRDYCEEAAERYASNEKTVNLLKAILDYGAYAQLYFGYDTNNLANRNLSTGLVETTAVPRTEKSESAPCTGLSKASSSLGLEAAFEMNTNFTPSGTASAEDMANYTFKIDGNAVLDPVLNNGRYTITLKDITAVTLGDMHTFTATHKDGSVYSVNDSPMGYLYRAYTGSSNVNLVHLCSAIYLYNQAAIAYFG